MGLSSQYGCWTRALHCTAAGHDGRPASNRPQEGQAPGPRMPRCAPPQTRQTAAHCRSAPLLAPGAKGSGAKGGRGGGKTSGCGFCRSMSHEPVSELAGRCNCSQGQARPGHSMPGEAQQALTLRWEPRTCRPDSVRSSVDCSIAQHGQRSRPQRLPQASQWPWHCLVSQDSNANQPMPTLSYLMPHSRQPGTGAHLAAARRAQQQREDARPQHAADAVYDGKVGLAGALAHRPHDRLRVGGRAGRQPSRRRVFGMTRCWALPRALPPCGSHSHSAMHAAPSMRLVKWLARQAPRLS